MKKNYVSPEIQEVKSAREGVILMHSDDWASGKKGFFDDEDDAQSEVAPTDKSVWDDEKNWD